MSCENCTPVSLHICLEKIVIGTSPDSNVNYYLLIQDVTNGKKWILPTDIYDSTKLIVDVENILFAENHSYEFYLLKSDDFCKVTWEINETEVDCLMVRFNKYFDNLNQIAELPTTQEISLC